jgi:glucokinase
MMTCSLDIAGSFPHIHLLFPPPFCVFDRAPGSLLLKKTYSNQNFKCFEDILRTFLKEAHIDSPPTVACFAVAGPVRNNIVRFTNRDNWEIDGDRICVEFGMKRVLLVNDFVALGYALLTLDEATECICLQEVGSG